MRAREGERSVLESLNVGAVAQIDRRIYSWEFGPPGEVIVTGQETESVETLDPTRDIGVRAILCGRLAKYSLSS
jgi:hypothetical protein